MDYIKGNTEMKNNSASSEGPQNAKGSNTKRGNKKKQQRKKLTQKGESQAGIEDTVAQEAVTYKLEVSRILTNLSLVESNLGNFNSSVLFALLAFGLGLDRFKAAFRIAKALNASGRKSEAKDVAAWYCRSCGLDSADSKLTAFQSEFEVTDTYIKSPSEINAAAWVQADTLEALVDASSSLKQESSKETPWLTIKKQGNDSFGQKDYSSAKDYYISALCSCPFAEDLLRDSSFIVSNKGAAWLGIVAEAKHTGASFNSKPDNIIAEGTISMLSAALMNFYIMDVRGFVYPVS